MSTEDSFCEDNGFPSATTMHDCHRPIVQAVQRALNQDKHVSTIPWSIMDLGCGNGALLRSISVSLSNRTSCEGIDCCLDKVNRNRDVFSDVGVRVIQGDIWFPSDAWIKSDAMYCVLLMVGYLLEGPNQLLKAWLLRHAKVLLTYAYEEDIVRFRRSPCQRHSLGLTFLDDDSHQQRIAGTFVARVQTLDFHLIGTRTTK